MKKILFILILCLVLPINVFAEEWDETKLALTNSTYDWVTTGSLDIGGDFTLENDEYISNATNNYVDFKNDAAATTFVRVLSAGNDKNLTLSHDDTDAYITTSSGDIILNPAANVGIGGVPSRKLTVHDATMQYQREGNHVFSEFFRTDNHGYNKKLVSEDYYGKNSANTQLIFGIRGIHCLNHTAGSESSYWRWECLKGGAKKTLLWYAGDLRLTGGGKNIVRSPDNASEIQLYHNNTDGFVSTTVGDLNLISASNTTIGDGGTTNYASIDTDGQIILVGDAKVKKTTTYTFNYSRITGQGKPTLVNRGIFFGFSLPIYNTDDEELYACECVPYDWDGTSNPTFYIGGWLDTANTSKNFKLQVSVEHWSSGDTVPTTSEDIEVETATGTAAQYTSFKIPFVYDAVSSGIARGDAIGIRVRRIDADTNEIAGEFVVEGAAVEFTSNRLGEPV